MPSTAPNLPWRAPRPLRDFYCLTIESASKKHKVDMRLPNGVVVPEEYSKSARAASKWAYEEHGDLNPVWAETQRSSDDAASRPRLARGESERTQ